MQYHALPCNTMQYNTVPFNAMQYHAIRAIPGNLKFFGISAKILGRECEINTAPKPLPEVAPSKMEVAPS